MRESQCTHLSVSVLVHLLLESQGSPISELMSAKGEARVLAAGHTKPAKGFGT
jgi:hypothetical protein